MSKKPLKENYKANLNILRENLRRGMTPSQALQVINSWRDAFNRANLYGDDEKEFINQALEIVESKTHLAIVEM